MAGSISINAVGKAHLDSLVSANKADSGAWTPPKGGSDPSWYLAVDSSEPATSEAHYKYPFTSDGSAANRKALASIESYATTNGQPDVASAAHDALAKLNGKPAKMSAGAENGVLKNVEIFKVGKWNAGTGPVNVTSAMLDDVVSNFGTINQITGYGVPLKLGHLTKPGDPAYGWMSDLARVGDTLVANFSDVDPAIVDAIHAKRYNSVSVELYPNVKYGDKNFKNVLGGVAALGAEWPAVKGLKPLTASEHFAGSEERLELKEDDAVNFTSEQHEAILASSVAKAVADTKALNAKELSDALAASKKSGDELVIAQTALKTFKDDQAKAEIKAVIEAAEKAGKIVPANKEKITKFAETVLSATDEKVRAELMATFAELVGGAPAKVTFGEKSVATPKEETAAGDKPSDVIATKANGLIAAHTGDKPLSFADAVTKVLASDPELKAAYAAQ